MGGLDNGGDRKSLGTGAGRGQPWSREEEDWQVRVESLMGHLLFGKIMNEL